jgi:DNA primase
VATLLEIDEHILIAEGNKLFLKQAQENEKEKQRQQRTTQVGDLEIPIQEAIEQPKPQIIEIQRSAVSYHEEECIRLLVNYGKMVIEKTADGHEIRLTDYVFDEIKEMRFATPIYDKFLSIFREFYQRNEIPETQYFTSHLDPNIQEQTINWVATQHQLSDAWAKFEIYIPEESDKLHEMAFTNVLRLKKARFEAEIETLTHQLNETTNDDMMMEILMNIKQRKNVVMRIAKELGTVVQG